MLSALKLHFSRNKPLVIATVFSLIIHTLFLSKFALTLPELGESHLTLDMHLITLPPAQKTTPAPIKKTIPKPVPKPQVTQDSSAVAQPTTTNDVSPITDYSTAQKTIPVDESQNTSISKQITTEPPKTEAIEPNDAKTVEDIAKISMPKAYKYVETEFEVRRGKDTSAAGMAKIIFSINENNAYTLNSTTEAKGIASLFFGKLIQRSEGYVTERGLVPNYFSYQYGNDKNKLQSADFAWSDKVLQMHSAKGDENAKLDSGTQDLLSFMYQFMFTPPLETMEITMTNGKNLRTYTYSFEGEEAISTKLGELKTVHLLKSGSEEEKTELWLSLDYQYLPVKIRKTEKNGSVIEQTAIHIHMEPQQ